MSSLNLAILLIILSFCLTSAGCDKPGSLTPQGEECGASADFMTCSSSADCVNGFCECTNERYQLARGFCLIDTTNTFFITTDQYSGLLDTLIFELEEDPWDVTWQNGDPEFHVVRGRMYNRSIIASMENGGASVMDLIFPGDFSSRPDTVVIFNFHDSEGSSRFSYSNDDWKCRGKIIIGKFINRDLIEGQIKLNLCESQVEGAPRPPEMEPGYPLPVTIRRWTPG